MALTLLPGMALAAEGDNPQPVVVKTAEELRAAMEAPMAEHDEIWLGADITLQKADISTTGAELWLNGHELTMNNVNINIKVSGNGNGKKEFSIVGANGGRVDSISNCSFTTETPTGSALVLYGAQVKEIRDSNFDGSLMVRYYEGRSLVGTIDGCTLESDSNVTLEVMDGCEVELITNNQITNLPAEGTDSIAIGIYHENKATIGRISGNKITAGNHGIFISNNSTLKCLAANVINAQSDEGSVFIENGAEVRHLHVQGNWMKNPHHEGMWLYQTVDGWTIGRHDAVNSAEIAPYTPDCEESDSDYINILKSENGEIIPSLRHAEAGERVTLNVHPDKGYELDELTVTDRRGRDITLRALGDSAYTFLMPNVRVTVEATFKAIKDATTPETTDPADEEFNGLGTPGISGIVLNPAAMPYTDVKGPDWFYNNVEYMWKHYLMSGVSDTQFAPNTTTNRGMIWTILARMNNVRTDINPGSTWYEKGMLWCKEQGITDGTNPLSDITREQLVTMLWRNAGKQSGSGDLSKFSDSADVSEYAVTAMRWAVGNGILNGENGQINPQGTATRAQVAAMVARYGDKIVR